MLSSKEARELDRKSKKAFLQAVDDLVEKSTEGLESIGMEIEEVKRDSARAGYLF